MPSKAEAVIIFGATGLVGKYISEAILNSATDFRRIGVFTSLDSLKTKAEAIATLKLRGAEVISGDINSKEDVTRALDGFDTVVSCVGRTALHTQVQLVQLADKHPDVKRFFPSEYGTDIEYGPSSAAEKPHQQKLKVRAQIRELKNLEYTFIVTGPFANADFGLYFGATPIEREKTGTFDVKRKRAVLLGTGDDKVSFTTMRDTGKFVTAALKNLQETCNRVLIVNSFTTTPRQILAEYEKQTGGQPWDVSFTSLEGLKQLEGDAWSKEDPMAGAVTLKRIWTEGGTLYDHRDNGVLGLENDVDKLQDAVKSAIEWQTQYA
ncbi:isoflavone reductase [Trichoderma arundinaceum]|uniref:Isoflavone reductase n=1 Tax=Trichoderma arundinaceum TaxID=490622 RepID=A0A395NFI2_TRIAR|nr:isoflavone reductase [Trichoderma arundinaceum]